ncbi:oligopeptide ABC transporter permease [Anaerobacillus isosaccharinicus]|uniref:ABC transporter permease n=1 Tax=Anaerobacillus isosaccharinicus TaxID=1532552 RepID=A0A1S2MHK5_9BACI|nr:oligopeptide ABC transporter permease [Anaerobacillus isosaccharinicus]MBA5584182.1 ABC transporter permease [Anaerobacillus isosaccharinicus]QOY37412.1 ABC transporter permease [Anaerobacillus isosaccharinicus]
MGKPELNVKNKLNNVEQTLGERRSLTSIIVAKFFQNKLAVIGLILLVIIVGSALLAPWIAPHDPDFQNLRNRLAAPSAEFLLGTDHLGRDIFSRLLFGGRVSLFVGFVAMVGAVTIGTTVGAVAGYFGGLVDAFLMRLVDIIISFPNIFLLITLVAVLEPSIDKLIMVFAFLSWTGTARLVRGEFLTLKKREFVLAARTIGMSNTRIIFGQILPSALGPVIVAATLAVGGFILAESALSFLGLGVQPPTSTWGNMLTYSQSVTIFRTAWWYPTFPGLMILLTVLSFNFVGDGLRDALDPRVIEK